MERGSRPSGGGHREHGHEEHGHDEHGHEGHDEHRHGDHGHDEHEHEEHGHGSHEEHGHNDHCHDEHDDHDHDDHGHDDHAGHDHSAHLRETSRRSLIIALVLIGGFMIVEVIGGILSGSLALLADAAHMITDAAAIALALLALWVAGRPASVERTFGYHRAEVLAAMLNALSLWLIAAYIFFEAYHRIFEDTPHIEGGLMLVVGTIGLIVNIAAAFVLHRSAGHSLNVQGAFLHVIADLIGSVGVVVSGVIIVMTGWVLADPILSVLLGLLIIASTWRLVVKVFNVLLEAVPEHIDVYALCSEMESEAGVTVIHDVHVWTISSGYDALTCHVLVDPDHPEEDLDPLLRRLREIAMGKHGISHVTIQLEQNVEGCTEFDHADHLMALERKGRVRKWLPF